ncbi:hypothetical protein ACFE04_004078 [Oxalis oulophora]
MSLLIKSSFTTLLLVLLVSLVEGQGARKEMVPGMFIFGDSLIDNGNNNDLFSFAKANYFPYGIDFIGGPTGRFSNGYTMVDQLSKMLGLPLIPSFSEASVDDLANVHGVNYASAAAGILDNTGLNFVSRIPFNQQIDHFLSTLDQCKSNPATTRVNQRLAEYLFYVGMGSNDYLNNYLMPDYPTKNMYNGFQYSDLLIKQYQDQLTSLYKLGARKFIVAGLGKIGCIPSILAQSLDGECDEHVNLLVNLFNAKAKAMINTLNDNLFGANFIFIDISRLFDDLTSNAKTYGFSVIDRGCCGLGRNGGLITCLPLQVPCSNRDEYVFWDAFHPTHAANVLIGKNAFNGNLTFVHPMNIEQLALLPIV